MIRRLLRRPSFGGAVDAFDRAPHGVDRELTAGACRAREAHASGAGGIVEQGHAGAARTRGEFAIDSVRRAIESVYGTAEARTTEEAADQASGR